MRVLCVSDIVVPELQRQNATHEFGPVDLIISCGDLPPEYLADLRDAFGVPLYYVRGNHDIRYDEKPPLGCMNLHGRIVHHGDLKILGLEGSRWYNGGPVQYTEAQMRGMVWRMRPKIWLRKGVDLMVTHAPPRHIHDAEDLCHRGFRSFRKLIYWHRPPYFLHGHIHAQFTDSDQRCSMEGTTRVINCFGFYRLDIHTHEAA